MYVGLVMRLGQIDKVFDDGTATVVNRGYAFNWELTVFTYQK